MTDQLFNLQAASHGARITALESWRSEHASTMVRLEAKVDRLDQRFGRLLMAIIAASLTFAGSCALLILTLIAK